MKIINKFYILAIIFFGSLLATGASATSHEFQLFLPLVRPSPFSSRLMISDVGDNRSFFTNGQIPKYEKFEITFQVQNSSAGNFYFPFDPSLPNGLDADDPAHQGISVDALFTPDNWQTVYRQPAFYYQYFEENVFVSGAAPGRDWFHPTADYAWKVRFSPNQVGSWHYKLVAQDASGTGQSPVHRFEVIDSDNPGFIRVSQSDGRYFEFDDGQLFYPLGLNDVSGGFSVFRSLDESTLSEYSRNGLNLVRIWISDLFGSAWPEWIGGRNLYDGYLPRSGIIPYYDELDDRFSWALRLDYESDGDTGWFDACRFQFGHKPEAIKPNTEYLLLLTYRGNNIVGPRDASLENYGLVGKIGDQWEANCYEPGTSSPVTDYGLNTDGWSYLAGKWHSGDRAFLPRIYLGLENVVEGQVYIESISLREDLGGGQFGPELISSPSMDYERYYPEREAYTLDKLVELSEQAGIHLKLVIHEKGDDIFLKLKDDGSYVHRDQDGNVEPDNQDGFYGVGRQINKTRWLQQAWWRYLQARWGYSTAVFSWELTNEGDPGNVNHYALADELGKHMHCQVFGVSVDTEESGRCAYDHPNDHLVTTSFWHSFPGQSFWANPEYPNIDYVDLHAYVSTGFLPGNPAYQDDAALFHLDYSRAVRNNLNSFVGENGIGTKPIIRGETGIDFLDEQRENPDLAQDLNGVWLHNLIWSTLDVGAMNELYWWRDNIATQPGPDGQPGLFEIYGYFSDFVADIPLANGYYQDAEAALSNSQLRVTGQKDVENGRAHLWIQNKNHIWRNVVDQVPGISGLSGTAALGGFAPQQTFSVEWHQFDSNGAPTISRTSTTSTSSGQIILQLPSDASITDVGIKIGS